MPQRALRACAQAGCAAVTDGIYCVVHRRAARPHDQARGNSAVRGYGAGWRRLRLFHLACEPLCRRCLQNGRTTAATDVDHITARRAGGTDDDSNLQSLCHQCHSEKTAREDGGFGLHTFAKGV